MDSIYQINREIKYNEKKVIKKDICILINTAYTLANIL